jgi:hypothetical protein
MFTVDLATERAGTANAPHSATYLNTPMSSVEHGAEAIPNLAASPDLAGHTGRCFNGLHEARADAKTCDAAERKRLKAARSSPELSG